MHRLLKMTLITMGLIAQVAVASEFDDVTSRAFSVFNDTEGVTSPVAYSDSLARPFSVFNDTKGVTSPRQFGDVVSRMFSLFNDVDGVSSPRQYGDAQSRSFSVFNDTEGVFNPIVYGDALSKMFSVFNDVDGVSSPRQYGDAQSRSFSVFNDTDGVISHVAYSDASSRDVSVFNDLQGVLQPRQYADAVSRAFSVLLPLADLVVSDVMAPTQATGDATMTISYTVANLGGVAVTGSRIDAILISADTYVGADVLATSITVDQSLAPGQSEVRTMDVLVPGLVSGAQYVYVIVDALGAVVESNTSNNTAFCQHSTLFNQPARPNLQVATIDRVSNGLVGSPLTVSWLVVNQSAVQATGAWSDRVYAVNEDTGQQITLGDAFHNTPLPGGGFYSQTLATHYPLVPGDYRLRVEVDRTNAVNEGLDGGELDNIQTAATVFAVENYVVSVSTPFEAGPGPVVVPLSGTAALNRVGDLLPNVPVVVQVKVQGTTRNLTAMTDSSGSYNVNFNSLAGEAGMYEVAAGPNSAAVVGPQDHFVIYGLKAAPVALNQSIVAGQSPYGGTITLTNPGDVSLTGLAVQIVGAPSGLTVSVGPPAPVLGPLATMPLPISISATDEAIGSHAISIAFSTAEGANASVTVNIIVQAQQPDLQASPSPLLATMVLPASAGDSVQTLVEFTLTNQGGAAAENVYVNIPTQPWLALATPPLIGTLTAGSSVPVIIQLNPPSGLALGYHSGTIVVSSSRGSRVVPFQFNAVSSQSGTLAVTVTDEFSYWSSPDYPKVAGAMVKLKEHYTGQLRGEQITGTAGVVMFNDLTVGYYDMSVTAPTHGTYGTTIFVSPTGVTSIEAFLPRQVVSYVWVVVPTSIPDQYTITIQALFETHVPAPVIEIRPTLLDLTTLTQEYTQVDLEIRNWGLIAGQNAHLTVGTHPRYTITPLITELGDLPGVAPGQQPVPIIVPAIIHDTQFNQGLGAPNDAPCLGLDITLRWYLMCGYPFPYATSVAVKTGDHCPIFPGGGGSIPPCPGCPIIEPPPPLVNPSIIWPPAVIMQEVHCNQCAAQCIVTAGTIVASSVYPILSIPLTGWASCHQEVPPFTYMSPQQFRACFVRGMTVGGTWQLSQQVGGLIFPSVFKLLKQAYLKYLKRGCKLVNNCTCLLPESGQQYACYIPCSKQNIYNALSDGCFHSSNDFGGPLNDPYLIYYKTHYERVLSYYALITVSFGDSDWLDVEDSEVSIFANWLTAFDDSAEPNTESGEAIGDTERILLNQIPHPSQLTQAQIDLFLNRWNNTVSYWGQGILTASDVPAGWDTNFIDQQWLSVLRVQVHTAYEQNLAEGIDDFFGGLIRAEELLLASRHEQDQGVCATVRIQLDQSAVLTRSAVQAALTIVNSGTAPLEQIGVDLVIRNEQGQIVNNLFEIPAPELENLNDVSGTGVIPPAPAENQGKAVWTIVPSLAAAPHGPVLYSVSGTLTYAINGEVTSIPLFPTQVTVLPNPRLDLDYFLETVVYGDDPFTPVVEPPVPFALGLRVRNSGPGDAIGLRITSAQPTIVENSHGLVIAFNIIGTQVGSQPVTPSLSVNFGTVPANSTAVGEWLLTSSLQGEFVAYNATFANLNGLGATGLSLIGSVRIIGMTHAVRAIGATDDGVPDFLAENPDVPDPDDLPDRVYLSDGTDEPVTAVFGTVTSVDPVLLRATISAPVAEGWNYVRIVDPFASTHRLIAVLRADGSALLVGPNAWLTNRTLHPNGGPDTPLHYAHLFDRGPNGPYTLMYEADTTPPGVVNWFSVKSHGAAGVARRQIGADGNYSESRGPGITEIEILFSEPIDPATLTPESVHVISSSPRQTKSLVVPPVQVTVTHLVGEPGVRLSFVPPLADLARHCITLEGVKDLAGNALIASQARRTVSALVGDVTGDRRVNNTDVGATLSLVGTNPIDIDIPTQVSSDVNTDGRIDQLDVDIVLAARGGDLRFVANPCTRSDSSTAFSGRNGGTQDNDSSGGNAPNGGGNVHLRGGDRLIIDGYKRFETITVDDGAVLRLIGTRAHLTAHDLRVESIASLEWVSGTIEIDGGTFSMAPADDLIIGCTDEAGLILSNGATVEARSVEICPKGELVGNGAVMCDVLNAGLIHPTGGRLALNGRYDETAEARLAIDLNEMTPDDNQSGAPLMITKEATIRGTMQGIAHNAPQPVCGNRYTAVRAGSIRGEFAHVIDPSLACGLALTTTSQSNAIDLHLTRMHGSPDINCDGLVNANDLHAVMNAWGTCNADPCACAADITGDGIVSAADLLEVINHWSE